MSFPVAIAQTGSVRRGGKLKTGRWRVSVTSSSEQTTVGIDGMSENKRGNFKTSLGVAWLSEIKLVSEPVSYTHLTLPTMAVV